MSDDKPKRGLVTGFRNTEGGNAERLAQEYQYDLRYLRDRTVWLGFDGKRWSFDKGRIAPARAAKALVKKMYALVRTIKDDNLRKEFADFCITSDTRFKEESMVAMARTEEGITALSTDFDTDRHQLNVQNGTLDLGSMTLRPHSRDDQLTMICNAEYDETAECPLWLRFLEDTFKGKPELIDYLQRALGYSLSGVTSAQCLFLNIGLGANGKSTLLNVVQHILGDYAAAVSFDMFAAKRHANGDNPRDGFAALVGKRFVKASECEEQRKLSEASIKTATGEDDIRTCQVYERTFSFRPLFKVWLATNHEPVITGTDDAIWRRIKRINFDHQVPPERRDGKLESKLKAEAAGILAWMARGWVEWQEYGLRDPVAVESSKIGIPRSAESGNRFFGRGVSGRRSRCQGDRKCHVGRLQPVGRGEAEVAVVWSLLWSSHRASRLNSR
jgi:putative DNA primase/helicase